MSFDYSDGGGCSLGKTLVADPFEVQLAALIRDREERDEWVGGNSRKQIGAENLLSVVAAGEARDDVAWDQIADSRAAIAGFHDVRHHRLHFDDLAAFRLGGYVDQRGGHQITSSVHAASVTTTSALADQNEPSDRLAMATTF